MKDKLRIPTSILLLAFVFAILFTGAHMLARQTTKPAADPCKDQAADGQKKKVVEHDPLADPVDELRVRAQKRMEEKNFKELQDSANELAVVSEKMSQEIEKGGQYVISIRVLDQLDQIEKLTKKVRSRAK